MKKALVSGLVFLLLPPGFSAAAPGGRSGRCELRAGYAYQYTNRSRPNNFQVIEVLPSVIVPLTGAVGPAWFRGRLDWNPELILGLFTHPYDRPIAGITPIQFHWEWETPCRWQPYLSAGASVLYANVNRRETRSDLNFNLQGGVGVYYRLNDSTSLILEYRHIHTSNAGLHEDNAGINTHNFLAGVSLRR